MAKLIILSVVFASFAIPVRLCKSKRPQRDLRRAQWMVFSFFFVWALMCLKWYPRLVFVE